MKMKLVVTQAFGDYAVGDEIAEDAAMKAASASHPQCVVRTSANPKEGFVHEDGSEWAAPTAPETQAAEVASPSSRPKL